MGIKDLNFQVIQWIFKLMGSSMSCMHISSGGSSRSCDTNNKQAIKLIQSDGIVKIYNRPIHASELMLQFPKHLVCHSDSFYIGKKIPHLSEKDKLQLGQKYFLLPKHYFQSVLSFVTIASSFAAATAQFSTNSKNNNAFLMKTAFDIQKTPSGSLQIRVSDDFISNLMVESSDSNGKIEAAADDACQEDAGGDNKLCTTPQLHKDYKQLVGCTRQWKPKLDSIKESHHHRRMRLRRFGSFGFKTSTPSSRKASDAHDQSKLGTQKQQQQQKINTTTTSSSSSSTENKSSADLHLHTTTSSQPCLQIF